MKVFRIAFFLFCFVQLNSIFAQGYKIKVKIEGLSDTTLILGHHFNDKLFPDDTIMVNKKGEGTFSGEEAFPGGMYILLTPENGYLDILLDKDQHFNVSTSLDNLVQGATIEGSEDNELFFGYQVFMMEKQTLMKELNQQKQEAQTDAEKEGLNKKIQELHVSVQDYQNSILEKDSDLFAVQFIRSTREVSVPDAPRDENGKVKDSTFQYRYYKQHYFDNMPVSDSRFLRTPLYEKHVMKYLTKVVPQIPDTLIQEVDFLIEASRGSDEHFRFMLITLFNHFAKSNIMGMDAVYLHIAEKYYIPEASWSNEKFITDLKETVAKQSPLIIGKKAPDMELMFVGHEHFINAMENEELKKDYTDGQMLNLHSLEERYTVLAFWEAGCGICKKSLTKMYDVYTNSLQQKGVKILAISNLGGIEGLEKWTDFVNDHELYEWDNCWNPYSYQHKIDYNIEAVPQYFVLDKNKNIIAKRIGPEDIEGIIDHHQKYSFSK